MIKPEVPIMSDAELLEMSKQVRRAYREAIRNGTAKLDPNAYRKLDDAIKRQEAA